MMRCEGCGEILEEGGAACGVIGESEAWGSAAFEYGAVCPVCGCDGFEDCAICRICGEILPEDEVWNGVCRSCLYDGFEFGAGSEYLRSIGDGNSAWSDFVLSRVYGVVKCEDTAFLLDALSEPSADFVCSDGKSAFEAMRLYIFEDWQDYAERTVKHAVG